MLVSASSWCLGRTAVCDCDTPWTSLIFLLRVPQVTRLWSDITTDHGFADGDMPAGDGANHESISDNNFNTWIVNGLIPICLSQEDKCIGIPRVTYTGVSMVMNKLELDLGHG